jgi:tetratricopeptide (TPR) repeat protein
VSQVRKDILNGWKEIGLYVGRDTRTVERWEKQRGLPVRRVPGAGRATVYALTTELDEWLENSKPEAADLAENGRAVDLPSGQGILTHAQPAAAREIAELAATQVLSIPAAVSRPKLVVIRSSSTSERRPASADRPLAWLASGRRPLIARITIAVAVGVLCVLVSPVVRSHANPTVRPSKYSSDSGERLSMVSYGSRISGVNELYLQGIYAYEQRSPESLQRALDDFSNVIAKDPNYAPAYAALSITYNLVREYSVMPEAEAYPKARAAAEHAIALDPKLSDAHASLGFIDFFWSWDTVSAEREFQTALALDPSSILAHHWYGSMLTHEGKYEAAIEQLDLAQRLEPTSAAILSTRALALGLSGHRGEAVDMLQDLISETPGATSPHAILSTLSRVEPQDPARFLFELHRTAELRHSDEMLQVATAGETALRSGGETAMWAAILGTEEQLHPGTSNGTFLMAEAETVLGHYDAAFADLGQMARRHDPTTMGIILDPTLSPLRRDRRFGQLIASMGLPTELAAAPAASSSSELAYSDHSRPVR